MPYNDPQKRRAYNDRRRVDPVNRERKRQYMAKYILDPENVARRRSYVAKYQADNKARLRSAVMLKNYGITLDEFNEMLTEQGNRCAICRLEFAGTGSSGRAPATDHDHVTGTVRGIIHNTCNIGIGKLGDNAAGLRRALGYLERAEARASGL